LLECLVECAAGKTALESAWRFGLQNDAVQPGVVAVAFRVWPGAGASQDDGQDVAQLRLIAKPRCLSRFALALELVE
jgi:hypothetical protein